MQATHFIEVWKDAAGDFIRNSKPLGISNLQWALATTEKFCQETIAIFKIYPKAAK
jgi:hypothetical protein